MAAAYMEVRYGLPVTAGKTSRNLCISVRDSPSLGCSVTWVRAQPTNSFLIINEFSNAGRALAFSLYRTPAT